MATSKKKAKKIPVKRASAGNFFPPAYAMRRPVKKRLKPWEKPFNFKGTNFLLSEWGVMDKKSLHIGLRAVDGKVPIGAFIAIASAYPLKEKIPKLNLKNAWEIEAGVRSKSLLDEKGSVLKRLVKIIEKRAQADGVSALVTRISLPREKPGPWESIGFKRIEGTNLYIKNLETFKVKRAARSARKSFLK